MGEPHVFKDDSPKGYGDQIEYTKGDEKVNTPEDKITEFRDIKKRAKDLAANSEHKDLLYPNITAKDDEKAKKEEAAEAKAENSTVHKANTTEAAPEEEP